MQRWTVAVFGAVLALFVVALVKHAGMAPVSPSRSAPPDDKSVKLLLSAPLPEAAPPLKLDMDAGIELPLDEAPPDRVHGDVLPSGASAPALPAGAPQSVSFGAVLVEYAGAQGASRGSRSRDEAALLAKKLADRAKTDFHAAVEAGDRGSGDDFGSVPRGMLEAGPEYVLFSLKVGEVSDPVDSPRGFYIFKRIE